MAFGTAAAKSPSAKARAAELLARPLREDANDLARVARHEAGHCVVAKAFGFKVVAATAVGKCVTIPAQKASSSFPNDLQVVALALAGPLAADREAAGRAIDAGWGDISALLSDGDWAAVKAVIDPWDARSILTLREAAVLAGGILAAYRPALERLTSALLRHGHLNGADIEALLDDVPPFDG